MSDLIIFCFIGVVCFVAGWIAGRVYTKNAPTERELALRAAASVTRRLAALKSTAPEEAVEAASRAAAEAEALKQFKDAAAGLQ